MNKFEVGIIKQFVCISFLHSQNHHYIFDNATSMERFKFLCSFETRNGLFCCRLPLHSTNKLNITSKNHTFSFVASQNKSSSNIPSLFCAKTFCKPITFCRNSALKLGLLSLTQPQASFTRCIPFHNVSLKSFFLTPPLRSDSLCLDKKNYRLSSLLTFLIISILSFLNFFLFFSKALQRTAYALCRFNRSAQRSAKLSTFCSSLFFQFILLLSIMPILNMHKLRSKFIYLKFPSFVDSASFVTFLLVLVLVPQPSAGIAIQHQGKTFKFTYIYDLVGQKVLFSFVSSFNF